MFSNYTKRVAVALLIAHVGFACGVDIFEAVKNGNVGEITRMLNENPGAICDTKGSCKYTPLHVAAQYGQVEALRLLLRRGADVNARGRFLRTPLYEAIDRKHVPVVHILIEHGADIEAKGFMKSPLYLAANRGLIDVVKLLIGSGAQVDNGCDEYELTPLHEAAKWGGYDMAVFLVQHGADITARAGQRQMYATPLKKAIERRDIELVKFLTRHGGIVVYDDFNEVITALLERQLQSTFPGYDWRVDKAEFHRARKESLMNTFALPEDLAKLILALEGVEAVQQKRVVGNSSEQE